MDKTYKTIVISLFGYGNSLQKVSLPMTNADDCKSLWYSVYIWGVGVGAGAGTYLHVRVQTWIYLHVRTLNSLVPSSI